MKKQRKLVGTIALVFAVLCLCPSGEAQTVKTPAWLSWLGDGTTSYSCSSGTCNLTGELWFTSFTVSSGATVVNKSGNAPLVIRATGACTIQGTVSGSPNSGSAGISGNGDFGGGSGGGGGGTAAGMNGKNTVVDPGVPIVNGGAGGAAGGGAGHSAISVNQGQYRMLLSTGSPYPGGGASGGQGGSNGGAGGNGGTPVIFICSSINFTGTIDVSGGAGGNAPGINTGAGGGGGGGYAILAAESYTSKSGTIKSNGGSGGSCNGLSDCGAGGAGGNGFSIFMNIE